MEELALGRFNLFGLFVMLVPGAITTALVSWLLAFPYDNSSPALVVFLALSYAVGLLFRPLVLVAKHELERFLYGGSTKEVFLKGGRLLPVIDDRSTRMLAKKCVDVACMRCRVKSTEPEFAFDYMVSCLDAWGKSGKSDRLHELSDTCMALAVTSLAGTLLMLAAPIFKSSTNWHGGGITALFIFAIGVPLFAYSAVRYERTRFSTVVRTFAASLEEDSIR